MARKKKDLEVVAEPVTDVAAEMPVMSEREVRWHQFLDKARTENALFAEQEARGEFNTIPESFV